jgi:hypothetical protein
MKNLDMTGVLLLNEVDRLESLVELILWMELILFR